MRILKVLGIGIASVVGLVLIAVVGLVVVGDQTVKKFIVDAVEQRLHRELSIDGGFSLTYLPEFHLHAEDISVANADWSERPSMAAAKRLDLTLDWTQWVFSDALDIEITLVEPFLSVERNAAGESNLPAGVRHRDTGSRFSLRPRFRQVQVTAGEMLVSDAAHNENARLVFNELWLGDIEGELQVKVDGVVDETPVLLDGSLGDADSILNNRSASVQLKGNAGDAVLNVAGNWGPVLPQVNLDLKADFHAESLVFLDALLPVWLQGIGRAAGEFSVTAEDGQFALPAVQLQLEGENNRIDLVGQVGDLSTISGIDLKLGLKTTHFVDIAAAAEIELPFPLPHTIDGMARLFGDAENLSAEVEKLTAQDEGVSASFTGRVDNLRRFSGVDGTLNISADGTDKLAPYIQREFVDLGPVSMSTELDNRSGLWKAESTHIVLTGERLSGTISGSVGDLASLRKVQLETELNAASLAEFNPVFRISLPETPEVTTTVSITADGGFSESMDIKGTLRGKNLTLSAEGVLADPPNFGGVNLAMSLQTAALQDWAGAFNRPLLTDLPITGSTRLQSLKGGGYRLGNARLAFGETNAEADITLVPPKVKGRECMDVSGNLSLDLLDFKKLLEPGIEITDVETPVETDKPDAAGDGKEKVAGAPSRVIQLKVGDSGRLFSDDRIVGGGLTECDLKLDFRANEIRTRESTLNGVEAQIRLADQQIEIDPIRTSPESGKVEGAFRLDARADPYHYSWKMSGEDVKFAQFTGTHNFELTFDGSGDSLADIMASLNGEAMFTAGDVVIPTRELQPISQRILSSLLTTGELAPSTEVECFFAQFDIKDGMVDFRKNIVIQTTQVTWLLGGLINLKDEKLEMYARSSQRRGVDLLGSFAPLVRVAGPLTQPRVELDPVGVVSKSLEFTALVATSGISAVLLNLFDRNSANRSVCEDALAERQDNAETTPAEESTTPEAPKASQPDANAISVH